VKGERSSSAAGIAVGAFFWSPCGEISGRATRSHPICLLRKRWWFGAKCMPIRIRACVSVLVTSVSFCINSCTTNINYETGKEETNMLR